MSCRVGIVSYWFNRGQGTVGRYLRSALEDRGHRTSVLARPTKARFARPGFVDVDDVWAQHDVTHGSAFDMAATEYVDWARSRDLDVVFFDQNYQFDAIRSLREAGVRTIGRFVWESFAPAHAQDAIESFDVIYSFTRAEQRRYGNMGIDSPLVPFGCHPELTSTGRRSDREIVRLLYPGGYLSKRKPTGAVLDAFSVARTPGVELVVKAQRPLRTSDLVRPTAHEEVVRRDRNLGREPVRDLEQEGVRVITDDLDTASYHRLFAASDACIAVSRWEGLGLHLFEATAFGVPLVVNDMEPLTEVVEDGVNGLVVASRVIGHTKSGVASHEPDVDDLARALDEIAVSDVRARLVAGTERVREHLRWSETVDAFDELVRDVTRRAT